MALELLIYVHIVSGFTLYQVDTIRNLISKA